MITTNESFFSFFAFALGLRQGRMRREGEECLMDEISRLGSGLAWPAYREQAIE